MAAALQALFVLYCMYFSLWWQLVLFLHTALEHVDNELRLVQ